MADSDVIGISETKKAVLSHWSQLLQADPVIYEATQFDHSDGIKGIFYAGVKFGGIPTRVFAWVGLPPSSNGLSVPGMVLLHGGGGTAFREWVEQWNQRGYAAIAMDLEGHIPERQKDNQWKKHEWSGPSRAGFFEDMGRPLTDQWMLHAVSSSILAHSVLRSMEGVDGSRIGVTGISWGGIITSIVSGVDDRFQFAIPVYGTGYLHEAGNHYTENYKGWSMDMQALYRDVWDPSVYLARARMPVFMINGESDTHFPLHITTKSFHCLKLSRQEASLCIRPNMKHNHPQGWAPQEIAAYADHLLRQGSPLPTIIEHRFMDGHPAKAVVRIHSVSTIVEAQLRYVTDHADRLHPLWFSVDVLETVKGEYMETEIPDFTKAYYIVIVDNKGWSASTELVEIPE